MNGDELNDALQRVNRLEALVREIRTLLERQHDPSCECEHCKDSRKMVKMIDEHRRTNITTGD